MKLRKFMTAAMIAGAIGTIAACGSDDNEPLLPTSAAETSVEDFEDGSELTNPDQRPSPAALNEMLSIALDPDVPNSEKVDLVEGAEADPDIFDNLVTAFEENPGVTYEIVPPVLGEGPGRGKVNVKVGLPDTPEENYSANIVYDDGRWKLAQSTVCGLLAVTDVQSAMCDAADTPPISEQPTTQPTN